MLEGQDVELNNKHKIWLLEASKVFWWVGGWWSPSDYSVCQRPLCWFYIRQELQFTSVYIGLHHFMLAGRDVELDNMIWHKPDQKAKELIFSLFCG